MEIYQAVMVLSAILLDFKLNSCVDGMPYIRQDVCTHGEIRTFTCSTRNKPRSCAMEFLFMNRTLDEVRGYEKSCYHKHGLCHSDVCECRNDCKTYVLKHNQTLDNPQFYFGCSATFKNENSEVFRISTSKLYDSFGNPVKIEGKGNSQDQSTKNMDKSNKTLQSMVFKRCDGFVKAITDSRDTRYEQFLCVGFIFTVCLVFVANNMYRRKARRFKDYTIQRQHFNSARNTQGIQNKRLVKTNFAYTPMIMKDRVVQSNTPKKQTRSCLVPQNNLDKKQKSAIHIRNSEVNNGPITRSVVYRPYVEKEALSNPEMSDINLLKDKHRKRSAEKRKKSVNGTSLQRKRFRLDQSTDVAGLSEHSKQSTKITEMRKMKLMAKRHRNEEHKRIENRKRTLSKITEEKKKQTNITTQFSESKKRRLQEHLVKSKRGHVENASKTRQSLRLKNVRNQINMFKKEANQKEGFEKMNQVNAIHSSQIKTRIETNNKVISKQPEFIGVNNTRSACRGIKAHATFSKKKVLTIDNDHQGMNTKRVKQQQMFKDKNNNALDYISDKQNLTEKLERFVRTRLSKSDK